MYEAGTFHCIGARGEMDELQGYGGTGNLKNLNSSVRITLNGFMT